MTKSEKMVFAKALADTFTGDELKAMRKKALMCATEGKVTSWSDVGLSSSISYDFNLATAVDILSAAIGMLDGSFTMKRDRIRKFVL